MSSTSETGHAVNSANFQKLLTSALALGPLFNPTKNALKLPQLDALALQVENALNGVILKSTTYNDKVNQRSIAYSGVRILATRLIGALEATDAAPQTIEDAKLFWRKLQGKRATVAKKQMATNEPEPSSISVSQLSFDQQIQHLAGLISLLQSVPSYAPNETDLTLTSLRTLLTHLKTKNNEVAEAQTDLNNERLLRNKLLYEPSTGLVAVASDVKKYIKSVYGAGSAEYKQMNAIAFKSM